MTIAAHPGRLTDREWRVAQELVRKTPVPFIADGLGMTDQSVVKCRIRIYAKLGVRTDDEFRKWYGEATGQDSTPEVMLFKVKNPRRPRLDLRAKLTSKGQITVPKAVREHFGLKPGQEVQFTEDEDGKVYIRRHLDPNRFEKWKGYLATVPGRDHLKGLTSDELVREMRGD